MIVRNIRRCRLVGDRMSHLDEPSAGRSTVLTLFTEEFAMMRPGFSASTTVLMSISLSSIGWKLSGTPVAL